MRLLKFKIAGLSVLLATTAFAESAIERAVRYFRLNPMVTESYLVVITPESPDAIAARFDVVTFGGRTYLNKEVTIVEGPFMEELLTLNESATLLEKFRAFDWGAKPRIKQENSMVAGCFSLRPRISFRARVEGAYREFEADATLVPALADLVGVIISRRTVLEKSPEPIPPAPSRAP